jgi:hypothetical protein
MCQAERLPRFQEHIFFSGGGSKKLNTFTAAWNTWYAVLLVPLSIMFLTCLVVAKQIWQQI